MHILRLIDFGLCTPFVENGVHMTPQDMGFAGNVAFCSKYAMSEVTRTRRDDMTSLIYLLMYLYKGNLEFLGID
jgi:hypothetical protein